MAKKTNRRAGDAAARQGVDDSADTENSYAPQGLEFHPLADLFPLLEGAEFDEFVKDVRVHDVRERIWLYEGKVLEGRNRYRAAAAAGVPCPSRLYQGDDPVGFVVSMNLKRRHLSASQRAMVAVKLATLPQGRPTKTGKFAGLSQAEAAASLKISERSVRTASEVREAGVPELTHAVEAGTVSVSAAADLTALPPDEQREVVAKGEREMRTAGKRVRSTRPAGGPRPRLGRPQDEKTKWRSGQEARVRAAIAGAEFDDWLRFQVDDELVPLVEQASRAWAKVTGYLAGESPATEPNRLYVEVPDTFAVARWSRDADIATIARCILATLKYEPHSADTTALRRALEGLLEAEAGRAGGSR
jgi:hypothetical protein